MNDNVDASIQSSPILNRRSIARAGIEIVSIVLGVLLALAVSEWQDNRNNTERTQAALRNVQTELSKNLELLEIVHGTNSDLVKELTESTDLGDQDRQFSPALTITDSAWHTLSSTGLGSYVDLDLMVTLSQAYSLVEVYRRLGYSLIDANFLIVATATATERDMKSIDDTDLFATNFIEQFELIVEVESALIDVHQKTLSEVDSILRD